MIRHAQQAVRRAGYLDHPVTAAEAGVIRFVGWVHPKGYASPEGVTQQKPAFAAEAPLLLHRRLRRNVGLRCANPTYKTAGLG